MCASPECRELTGSKIAPKNGEPLPPAAVLSKVVSHLLRTTPAYMGSETVHSLSSPGILNLFSATSFMSIKSVV